MFKKPFSIVIALCLLSSVIFGCQDNVIVSAKEKSVADYTYTIIPILEPFNKYFFVKTDNPDPTSFCFVDRLSKYGENAKISFDCEETYYCDDWRDGVNLYADIKYENEKTGRVNGGYIFKSYNTDGGEVILQSKNDAYYSWQVTWSDTKVKFQLPSLKDDVDYLISTYATKKEFFDNMDAVQSGFSSICLYSDSYIRGELCKSSSFWSLSTSPHIDQSFYLQSPYYRKENKSLFAATIYPFSCDSLGFPSKMVEISKRLDSSSSYKWNEERHWLVDVTYKGEAKSYGGQGNGKGQGITEDQIKEYFSFGTDSTKITLQSVKKLLEYYSGIKIEDDVPREDALTWEKICDTVGSGAWVRLIDLYSVYGGWDSGYTYLFKGNDGKSHWTGDAGDNGAEIYWSGDLMYFTDAWVDGRYIDAWECFVLGAKFEDHPTSSITLNDVKIPQVTCDCDYEYNYDTGRYEKTYSNIKVVETVKTAWFDYDEKNNIWIADCYVFDEEGYYIIKELTEKGLIDKRYLDMVTLTLDEVKALHVDRNTDIIPEKGFIYDGTVEPGTPYEYISLTDERVNMNLSSSIFTYDGKVNIPKITVTCKGKTLKENTDYTVTYSNKSSKDAGRYTIKIEGIGEYKGSVTKSYRIVPQAKSIKIDKTAVDICVGENSMLKATTDPTGAVAGVVWTSSNTKVATVTNGVVTGISKGTATITAKTNDGKTASCTVKVSVAVTGVTLNKTALTLNKGETTVLTATVMPSDAGNKSITWTSSNEKVAIVSNGKITAKSNGTATITAMTNNGEKSSCMVTVIVPVTEVNLNKNLIILTEGKSSVLTASVVPNDATDKNVIWTSNNPNVAAVSNGKVVAVHEGSASIIATATNGKSTVCTVMVRKSGLVYALGDVNGDDMVDIADALLISRFDAGLIDIDESQIIFADVNKDNSVDISDALMVARFDAGLITAF